MATVPNLFAAVTSATGAQLDENFVVCADKAGLASQTFSVAPATAAAHAVRADQLSADNTKFPIYSEPAWTPTVTNIGGTATFSVQVAQVTKIGRKYFCDLQVTCSATGTVGTAIKVSVPGGAIASPAAGNGIIFNTQEALVATYASASEFAFIKYNSASPVVNSYVYLMNFSFY